MPLIRYKPVTDSHTTHWLREPYDADGERLVQDLGELSDGYRYVLVPDDVTLPTQPVVAVEELSITGAVQARLKKESPQIRLMEHRRKHGIHVRFPESDIVAMERIRDTVGNFTEFVDTVRNKNATERVSA